VPAGLEPAGEKIGADAVILLLDEVETLRERRIAYVGMGRARSVLTVIGPSQLSAALSWSQ